MIHDVIIIGGGLVGTAAAYYLSRDGATVLLIEQGELNRGASGQNAGSLHFQMEHRLIEHGEAMSALAATILPLSLDAISRWGGITKELGESDLDVVMHGGLMLAETSEQVAKLERKRDHEAKWGLPTEILDAAAVRSLAPYLSDTVLAAAFCPVEGHGNPRLITSALARGALARGVSITAGTKVISTRREGRRWQIEIEERGTRKIVTSEVVLNACGAWTGRVAALADLHIPVLPVALTMNATTPMRQTVGHLIQHVGKRISMKQLREGNVLVGGGWSARMQRTGDQFDLSRRPLPNFASIQSNLSLALDLVPALEQAHLLRSWTGTVGVTADSLPILGEVPQAPGYFVATGGSGFTLGLTYGALMSEAIRVGRTKLDISLFSPARFNHVNMFMGQS